MATRWHRSECSSRACTAPTATLLNTLKPLFPAASSTVVARPHQEEGVSALLRQNAIDRMHHGTWAQHGTVQDDSDSQEGGLG